MLALTLSPASGCNDGPAGDATTVQATVDGLAPARPSTATRARPLAPSTGAGAGDPSVDPRLAHLDRWTKFFGAPEYEALVALATVPVASVEKGRGGRSLGFKITLADGTVGYFKPEQSFSGAHWYAEVASYVLDRQLELGRVPPTVSRRLTWAPLLAAAGDDERVEEITVREDGTVRGAFIAWVPGGLVPLLTPAGWEQWLRQSLVLGVTPYQRASEYQRGLVAGPPDPRTIAPAAPPDTPSRPGELADMILFDYLTANIDRWSSDRTNVRTRGPGGPLVYLDNGAGFAEGRARNGLIDARMQALQRFRRETVEKIRALDLELFAYKLAQDPEGPILSPTLLDGIRVRREAILAHVAAMETRFGALVYAL